MLIDEIIDGVDGDYVCALKYVNKNEHYFKGHFPNKPMMPGVLIIGMYGTDKLFFRYEKYP